MESSEWEEDSHKSRAEELVTIRGVEDTPVGSPLFCATIMWLDDDEDSDDKLLIMCGQRAFRVSVIAFFFFLHTSWNVL